MTHWQPEFDVMSPKQEELVLQFCIEIAGLRGQPGRPPDPIRLLEMAAALYQAEYDHYFGGASAAADIERRPTILGAGMARGTDPVTSHAAGQFMVPRLQDLFKAVHLHLINCGERGATTLEIAEATGLPRVSVSPRMKQLEDQRLVVRSAEKRGKPLSIVWRASRYGAAITAESASEVVTEA